jgi:hypothetical protein
MKIAIDKFDSRIKVRYEGSGEKWEKVETH